MMFEFKGKGVFVFSDPGGARAVLSQAFALKGQLSECTIIADREYSFIGEYGLQVIQSPETPEDFLRHVQPDFVFTGTSYTSKIELAYIQAAKQYNIKTYSFIDHWTSLRERFNFLDGYVFPDHILVIDERAKKLAIETGIQPSLLTIFGNPYYLYLEKWKPKMTKAELLVMLQCKKMEAPLIVYAPDPLSNVEGRTNYGFDEISATQTISKILDSDTFTGNFVVKLHPNQNKDKLLPVIGNKMIVAGEYTDSNLLLFHSDLVIGFFSNFLIEASLMKKKILRYHPHPLLNDPLGSLAIGRIVDTEELRSELNILNEIK